jgi:hypothetical protein
VNAADDGTWRLDPASYLAALRREFPDFGIIADPGRPLWMAVRGDDVFIRATDGPLLRRRLLELRHRRGAPG